MAHLSKTRNQLDPAAVNLVEIDEASAGQRVDNFLAKILKGVPKSHIYRILRSGEVRVNSKRVEASHKLEMEDVVRVPPVRMAAVQADAAPKAPARGGSRSSAVTRGKGPYQG